MPQQHSKSLPEDDWRQAVDEYELGTRNAVEIAHELGVSAATVSREFKRRGARKACRVHESIAELEATLDAKARRDARQKDLEWTAAAQRMAVINKMIGEMVMSLVVADRAGNLSLAAPMVTEVARALGVRGVR